MSYETYKFLHIISMLTVTTGVGALIAGATGGFRRGLVIVHGIAMLVLLVAGFGALAKMGVDGFPAWVWAKLFIWLVIGVIIIPARLKPERRGVWTTIVVVLAILASWLALYKPF